jgi:hypothetical protein
MRQRDDEFSMMALTLTENALPADGGAILTVEDEAILCAVARDGAAGGRRKMRGEDEPPAVGMLPEEFNSRPPRLIGIRAEVRAP